MIELKMVDNVVRRQNVSTLPDGRSSAVDSLAQLSYQVTSHDMTLAQLFGGKSFAFSMRQFVAAGRSGV